MSGAEGYKVWCVPYGAVHRTHVDGSYGHCNMDPVTVLSRDREIKVQP